MGADDQERIHETSLVQKGGFIQARGTRPRGQKELHWGCEGGLTDYILWRWGR